MSNHLDQPLFHLSMIPIVNARAVNDHINVPWMLAGDFNETRSLEERDHGGKEMARRCAKFNNWIENNGLLDMGFSGPKFTWSGGKSWSTRKNARLDRPLCNTLWRARFQEGAVRHLIQT